MEGRGCISGIKKGGIRGVREETYISGKEGAKLTYLW